MTGNLATCQNKTVLLFIPETLEQSVPRRSFPLFRNASNWASFWRKLVESWVIAVSWEIIVACFSMVKIGFEPLFRAFKLSKEEAWELGEPPAPRLALKTVIYKGGEVFKLHQLPNWKRVRFRLFTFWKLRQFVKRQFKAAKTIILLCPDRFQKQTLKSSQNTVRAGFCPKVGRKKNKLMVLFQLMVDECFRQFFMFFYVNSEKNDNN